jgi:hypothetical protein
MDGQGGSSREGRLIVVVMRRSQIRPLQESRARRRGAGGRRSGGAAASMDADPRGAGALPGHRSDSGRPTGRQQPGGEEEREEGKGVGMDKFGRGKTDMWGRLR